MVATVAPVGIFFGRITNFINSELYGKPTDIFLSVVFPQVDKISRHPSQLYEALLEGVVLFIILITVSFKKNIKTGLCSGLFMILYGIFRIISEQFREPDMQIGYLFNLKVLILRSTINFMFILKKMKKNENIIKFFS